MRSVFFVPGPAVLIVGCAPNTIIANRQQAVVEAWSSEDAVALARKECEHYGRYAHLERLQGGEFWFSCRETEEAVAARLNAAMAPTAAIERSVQPAAETSSQTAQPKDVKPDTGTSSSSTV